MKLSSGEVISKKAHDYEVKDRQKPTCTTDGYVLSVCKACGDEKKETLPATGHQHTEIRNKRKQPARQRAIQEICIAKTVERSFPMARQSPRPRNTHGMEVK
ncbi:hypothetical protein NIA73_19175 [Anaerobutyricum hallii]|nr:hypothetical protein [Anaerobutyricum hallii]